MKKVISKDGTHVAYQRTGTGPPLVLVHGTTADHGRWAPILPALEQHFTVYALDRRGRGESGDAEPYAIEREFEDVAAVVDASGGKVCLLGHSYGALCALEAALLSWNIRKLVLYEPPIPVGMPIYPPQVIERVQALVDKGEREEALVTFLQEVVRMPETELEMLRSSPLWPLRIAAAHTIPREMRVDERYVFEPERFRDLPVPTLLLLGSDSPAFFRAAIEAVHAALPDSHIEVLEGQQHVAMNTAPRLFLDKIIPFLSE